MVHGLVTPSQAASLCVAADRALAGGAPDLVCEVRAPLALAVADAVARLHLTARRNGARLLVRRAADGVPELLALVGLGLRPASEAGRHPEALEQRGIEEVVHVLDAPP